jgi:hypothetical protein
MGPASAVNPLGLAAPRGSLQRVPAGLLFLLLLAGVPGIFAASAPPDPRDSININSKTRFTPRHYSDLKSWELRKQALRRQILASAGLWPLGPRPPVPVHRFGKTSKGLYAVEKIALETLPRFLVGANLYWPERLSRPAPAVLVAHGHWKHGRTHMAEDYSVPALCANLAAQGYIVLAWDMVGYGDTHQLPHSFGDSPEELAWLFSPFSLQLWNAIRALDFIESLPEVNRFQIGMTGTSGGGTQTYLLAAVDERIRAAAPGGMVSATFQGDDVCEMAPGLRIGTNNLELASLIAPRRLLLVAATGDWTRDTMKVELPAIRSVYAMYRQEGRASAVMIDAGHNSNRESREAVYAFFQRALGRRFLYSAAPKESVTLPLPTREELLIGDAIRMKATASRAEILAAWKAMAIERTASMDLEALRERLSAVLSVSLPDQVTVPEATPELILLRTDTGTPVRAMWVNPPGENTSLVEITVSPEGLACTECQKMPPGAGNSRARLLVEVYKASLPPQPFQLERATFHRSLLSERVQDVLAAVRYAAGFAGGKPIVLSCTGHARAWCLLAAAAAPPGMPLEMEGGLDGAAAAGLAEYLNRPGSAYAGGLSVLFRLASRGAAPAETAVTIGK